MTALYDAGECRSCGAPIIWAVTDAGKAMPVDPIHDPGNGNIALHRAAGEIRAAVVPARKAAAMRAAGHPMYIAHFGSCPHADRWRRTR